jgi:hypothetical protein
MSAVEVNHFTRSPTAFNTATQRKNKISASNFRQIRLTNLHEKRKKLISENERAVTHISLHETAISRNPQYSSN